MVGVAVACKLEFRSLISSAGGWWKMACFGRGIKAYCCCKAKEARRPLSLSGYRVSFMGIRLRGTALTSGPANPPGIMGSDSTTQPSLRNSMVCPASHTRCHGGRQQPAESASRRRRIQAALAQQMEVLQRSHLSGALGLWGSVAEAASDGRQPEAYRQRARLFRPRQRPIFLWRGMELRARFG